ncbi:MAG: carboxymuconolactone decarboxylase family protein [Alphaproteobacteria bacterium]|nr:carboxymuconolactone decarboxylase family protein [Alphaproteobacteria bacterium]
MSNLPRIGFDDLTDGLKRELDARVRRLGYLGEFFQVAAHQPEPLGHFIRFTESLKEALPIDLVELLALTISTFSGNAYERVQHERLALKSGLTEAWVVAVERLAPDGAEELTQVQRAAQKLGLAMAAKQGKGAKAEADALLALTDAPTLMGVMLTVGRYLAHAAICNTLEIAAPVASPIGARP